jgi:hypothetical protein
MSMIGWDGLKSPRWKGIFKSYRLSPWSYSSCSALCDNVSTPDGTAEGPDHPVSTLCGHTEPRVPPLRRRVSQRHTKEKFELGRTKARVTVHRTRTCCFIDTRPLGLLSTPTATTTPSPPRIPQYVLPCAV